MGMLRDECLRFLRHEHGMTVEALKDHRKKISSPAYRVQALGSYYVDLTSTPAHEGSTRWTALQSLPCARAAARKLHCNGVVQVSAYPKCFDHPYNLHPARTSWYL